MIEYSGKRKVMPKRNYLETRLQMACVQWFDYEYPKQRLMMHMNHNESRSAQEMAKLKKMGVRPGCADLEYVTPAGKIVFIELKTAAGRQSKSQKIFEAAAIKHNAEYHIIRDVQQFINLIRSHNKKT